MSMTDTVLDIKEIRKEFVVKKTFTGKPKQMLCAVDGVSMQIKRGEVVGLVGESGCGKSTLGRVILKLHQPTSGTITFCGTDITSLSEKEMLEYRKRMQLIFQDPYASLNPRMTIYETIASPLKVFGIGNEAEQKGRVSEMLLRAGLSEEFLTKYPHEMSGGQRQRVVIARALILNPEFVIGDEPVSALDVSVRAQILNLIKKMQKETQTTYLFISHDLSVVRHLCDRIYVMYLGKIVECAPKEELFDKPAHPYTKALLSAIPLPDVNIKRDRILLSGDVPSPMNPPKGCRFHTRCPYAQEQCGKEEPALTDLGNGHFSACWLNAGKYHE